MKLECVKSEADDRVDFSSLPKFSGSSAAPRLVYLESSIHTHDCSLLCVRTEDEIPSVVVLIREVSSSTYHHQEAGDTTTATMMTIYTAKAAAVLWENQERSTVGFLLLWKLNGAGNERVVVPRDSQGFTVPHAGPL